MPWIEQDPPSSKYRGTRGRSEEGADRKAERPGLKNEPAVDLGHAPGSLQRSAREGSSLGQAPGRQNTDHPLTISRKSVVLWVSGTVFLLIWAFILGVVVGRGTIFQNKDFQALEKRLSLSDPTPVTPEVVVPGQEGSGPSTDSDQSPPLTFYDALAQSQPKPERGVPDSGVTKVMPPLPKKPEPAAQPTPEPDPDQMDPDTPAKSSPAAPVGQPAKLVVTSGVKTVEAAESVAPPPKRGSGENFTVQVAISSTAERAGDVVKKLKGQGFDAYYYQVEHEGRRYFRIRVGRYEAREQAQVTMERLAAAGHENMFISALTD